MLQYRIVAQHAVECGICACLVDLLFGVRLGFLVFSGYTLLHPITKWLRPQISVFLAVGGLTHLLLLWQLGGTKWLQITPFVPISQILLLLILLLCWTMGIAYTKSTYSHVHKNTDIPTKNPPQLISTQVENSVEEHVTVHCFL